MSVPTLATVLRNLRNDGEFDLADRIQKEAEGFRCESCGFRSNPGFSFAEGEGEAFLFHCPFCSPEKVRQNDEDPPPYS